MNRLVLSVLLLVAALLSGCAEALPTSGPVRSVTVEQALERYETVEDLVVIDLRTDAEIARGTIPGSIQLDFYADDFEDRVAELDRSTPYLVYCAQGGRSGSTGGLMRDLGFEDVADMTAGFGAWASAGNPTVLPDA